MASVNTTMCFIEILDFLSSSSSDDEEIVVLNRKRRKIEKIKNFLDTINQFDNKEFRKHFRLSRGTADTIIEEYQESPYYIHSNTWRRGSPMKSAACEVFLFLWFAANKTSLREVGQRFDVSISTAHKIVRKLVSFFVSIAPKYIHFPSPEEKENVGGNFEKISGFPNTIGCIDGTSIPLTTPANKVKSTYTNRHNIPAMTLQAICNEKKQFIDVFTGIPAKVHDSRVLKLSDIYDKLPKICGVHYHILGDSAYHSREWLITPYKDYGNLNEKESRFNKAHCKTRVLIENSFGLLKSTFRQLLQVHMHKVERISKFIIACCVLHNLCLLNNDELENAEIIPFADIPAVYVEDSEVQLRLLGEIKRNSIANRYFT